MNSKILQCLFCLLTFMHAITCNASHPIMPDADISEAFPDLIKVTTPNAGITIYFAPSLTEILTGTDSENREFEEIVGVADRPIKTKLLGKDNDYFIVQCDHGVSADPGCQFIHQLPSGELEAASFKWASNGNVGKGVSGLRFILPGNGIIYVDGHANTNFNHRQKFEWQDGIFIEVKQPFLYVGLDSTTIKSITLYENRDFIIPVAQLPSGSAVTVLINVPRTDDYLLKTPFGLVGWAQIHVEQAAETIRGLYFMGD